MDNLTLTFKFLDTANKAIKDFPHKKRVLNFFDYMGIGVAEFLEYAKTIPDTEIEYAIFCIETDQWDQSNFIMTCER